MDVSQPPSASPSSRPVLVIGAGLAGLACGVHLHRAGVPVHLLEAADAPGGRVRTDRVDGFLLDRGFQVLLTSYPEARQQLDLEALRLACFPPGAQVWRGGRWHLLADPFRRPWQGLLSAFSPVGSWADKARVGLLRLRGHPRALTPEGSTAVDPDGPSTLDVLRQEGFSEPFIDGFFRPFLGGIFLEPDLATHAEKFASVFRSFSRGAAALPAEGMEALPRQLAALLPEGSIECATPVRGWEGNTVYLAEGRSLKGRAVVVATDATHARAWLEPETPPVVWNRTTTLYWAAPQVPVKDPSLRLNGEGEGPVQLVVFPSLLQPGHAPAGQHLVSVTLRSPKPMPVHTPAGPILSRDDPPGMEAIRTQLETWFGPTVRSWRSLCHSTIPEALPFQARMTPLSARVRPGLYRCGDYCGFASIDTALRTGREAAEALLEDVRAGKA